MPFYVYKTVPAAEFELRQSIADAAPTHDPGSGRPVCPVVPGDHLNLLHRAKGTAAPVACRSWAR